MRRPGQRTQPGPWAIRLVRVAGYEPWHPRLRRHSIAQPASRVRAAETVGERHAPLMAGHGAPMSSSASTRDDAATGYPSSRDGGSSDRPAPAPAYPVSVALRVRIFPSSTRQGGAVPLISGHSVTRAPRPTRPRVVFFEGRTMSPVDHPEDPDPSERFPAGPLYVPVRPGPAGCTARFFRTPSAAAQPLASPPRRSSSPHWARNRPASGSRSPRCVHLPHPWASSPSPSIRSSPPPRPPRGVVARALGVTGNRSTSVSCG